MITDDHSKSSHHMLVPLTTHFPHYQPSMASSECCGGTLHEGTPGGRVEVVHGLPSYVIEPPNGAQAKGVVVIIPDVSHTFAQIQICLFYPWVRLQDVPRSIMSQDTRAKIFGQFPSRSNLDLQNGRPLQEGLLPHSTQVTVYLPEFMDGILPMLAIASLGRLRLHV